MALSEEVEDGDDFVNVMYGSGKERTIFGAWRRRVTTFGNRCIVGLLTCDFIGTYMDRSLTLIELYFFAVTLF